MSPEALQRSMLIGRAHTIPAGRRIVAVAIAGGQIPHLHLMDELLVAHELRKPMTMVELRPDVQVFREDGRTEIPKGDGYFVAQFKRNSHLLWLLVDPADEQLNSLPLLEDDDDDLD